MYKKLLVLILSLSLIVSAFSACSSKQPGKTGDKSGSSASGNSNLVGNVYKTGPKIVENPVTLKVAITMTAEMKKSMAEREVVINAEKDTNVKIEWDEIQQAALNEKLNLAFASGDMDDIYLSQIPNMGVQVANKNITPLTKLYEDYAPYGKDIMQKYPVIKKAITWEDGNIYSYFRYNLETEPSNKQQDCLYINKMWLDKLGLKIPETTDDFYNVLKAFKEKDPNGNGKADEIPFSLEDKNKNHSLRSMYGSFGVLGEPVAGAGLETLYVIKDNKVVFSPAEQGYYEALKYFHKLYAEGLLDKEIFTQNTAQLQAKAKHKDYILGAYIQFNQDTTVSPERVNDYVQVLPLKGPNGDRLWKNQDPSYPSNNMGVVTSKCKTPEVALRWLDYWTSKPLEAMYGPEGLTWAKVGTDSYTMLTNNVKDGMTYAQLRQSNNLTNGSVIPFVKENVKLTQVLDDRTAKKVEEVKKADPFLEKQVFRTLPSLPKPDDQAYLLYTNDMINYLQNFYAQAIIEGLDDAKWQAHMSKLKSLNYEKWLKADQEKFDKWLSVK